MLDVLNEPRAGRSHDGRSVAAQPTRFIDSSLRPPVYFFHFPKTAGTSLRNLLADQYSDDERCPAGDWESLARLNLARSDMARYRLFAGHFSANFADHLPPGVRTFTFLREPIQRFISGLRHLMRAPQVALAHGLHDVVRGRSLNELIYDDLILKRNRSKLVRALCCDVPPEAIAKIARTQVANGEPVHIKLKVKASLDKALTRLNDFDFVGDTADFANSLLALCNTFGFLPPETAPAMNKWRDDPRSTQSHSSDGLSDADMDHLRRALGDDVALYEAAKAGSIGRESRRRLIEDLFRTGIMREVRGPFRLDLGRPFSGSGWYGPERGKDGAHFRWSGPSRAATLFLPVTRDRARKATMRLIKPDGISDVAVFVDDQIVHPIVAARGRLLTLEFPVPARQGRDPADITTIKIDTGRVDTHGGLRLLGVALISLELASLELT
jgi:hypothetical protein